MTFETRRIDAVARQVRGVTYSKGEASSLPLPGYVPIIRAGNIVDGVLDLDDLIYVPNRRVKEQQILLKGDVVVAASSGSLDVVGKAARANGGFAGAFGAFCKVLRPKAEIDARYFAHFFQTPTYRRTVSSLAAGANINNLKNEHLDGLLIPVPPMHEQRRIAAILDQADALRAKRRQGLAHLDDLTQSIFLDMFGDPVTNPRGWPVAALSTLGQLDRGVSRHRPRNDPLLLGGRHPLVQTGEVANSGGYIREFTSTYSDLGLAQSKTWTAGTLCITIAANIAKTGILTFDACFPDSVVGFTADQATTEYVRVWLGFLQGTLERSAPQSAQKNINLAILRNLTVPTPPARAMGQFLDHIQRLEEAKDLAMSQTDALDGLFASLQRQAFSGRL